MRKSIFIICVLLVFAMVMSMAGCRAIGQKVAEGAVENAMEDALGGDVDIGGDGMSIETEDGSISAGTDMEWPAEAMGDLPVPKAKITFVMNDNTNAFCTVEVSDFAKEEAEAYQDALIALGYTEGMQAVDESSITFSCVNNAGASAMFIYDYEAKTGNITYTSAQNDTGNESENDGGQTLENGTDGNVSGGSDDENEENSENEEDMTDAAPWPADFMGDIPELPGKITGMQSNGTYQMSVGLSYVTEVDANAFIGALQACGYTVEVTTDRSEDSVEFTAYDGNDNYAYFYWNTGDVTFELTKPE